MERWGGGFNITLMRNKFSPSAGLRSLSVAWPNRAGLYQPLLLWLVPAAIAMVVVAMCLGVRSARRRAVLGCLREENVVKRLPGPGRRDHGFRAEVATLGGIRHRNIVRLLGFASGADRRATCSCTSTCRRGRGAASSWAGPRGTASGAEAACACSPRILHRDVKSNHILLDSAMEAHVADFGLAKFLRRGASCSGAAGVAAEECVSAVAGTYGYIAPGKNESTRRAVVALGCDGYVIMSHKHEANSCAEYAYTLRVDEKTDVYSFGVVLLELVTGRRPLGDLGDEIDLVHWARSVAPRPTDAAAVLAVADPRLPPEPAVLIASLFRVGISCALSARAAMHDQPCVRSYTSSPASCHLSSQFSFCSSPVTNRSELK
ncbi:hypothetical protein U9M48_025639 [Paspalum notatum var. saurae]|uniref:Protein kinase domain-containing protein n=1 Tax=Paspalum notatum var. saurae TaxID=547442 RepID=A0AAQ3WXJ6_PASNO